MIERTLDRIPTSKTEILIIITISILIHLIIIIIIISILINLIIIIEILGNQVPTDQEAEHSFPSGYMF